MLTQYSRRGFLGALGLGVAGAMVAGIGGLTGVNLAAAQQSPPDGRFGRMFRLPPFAQPSPQMEAALRELGQAGGLPVLLRRV